MADAATNAPPLKVLVLPDFRGENPYQQLLADHVPPRRAELTHAYGYRRVFPILRQVLAYRPDVLHLHWLHPYLPRRDLAGLWFFGLRTLLELALVRLRGVRVVWTIHNAVPHEARHRALECAINRWVARVAARVIVHSNSALAEVSGPYGLDPRKATVIPHGHYRDCYAAAPARAEARARLGLPADARILLFLGLLRPYKGVEALIDSWDALARVDRLPADARLVIAGKALDPEYEAALRARVEGVPSLDFRPGFVADEALPLYFGAADAAILPFTRILTSGSLLLAMSFACPVIAPALPPLVEALGPPEQDGAGALLYPPHDPGALQQALCAALDADLAALRGQVARRCDALGWDRIGRATAEVYEAAAGRDCEPDQSAH